MAMLRNLAAQKVKKEADVSKPQVASSSFRKDEFVVKASSSFRKARNVVKAYSSSRKAENVIKAGDNGWKGILSLVDKNLSSALGTQTQNQYNYWWSRFEKFCSLFQRKSHPFSELTVVGFLSWLAEESPGLGGVDQARAALRHFHNLKFPNTKSPTDGVHVSMALKGIKRRFQKPTQKKKPLAVSDFSKLLISCINGKKLCELKLVDLRFAAQISVLFCAFARYEESAALKVEDLVEEDGDFIVNFPKGKQYQHGESREGVILNQPNLKVNPVEVLKVYLDRLKSFSNASCLFPALRCHGKKIVLLEECASYDCVLRQFKHHARLANISGSPDDYGLHSFRRGAVTNSVNNGCDEHTVQKQMRVASTSTVARYATLDKSRLGKANKFLFK